MKICVAQIKPNKGDIQKNIDTHKKFIKLAVSHKSDAIFFPELSVTGYEPELAKDLATDQDDRIFDDFQKLSDINQITIGVGMPTKTSAGIQISMIIFQPGKLRQIYSKQHLHSDEYPYFVCGDDRLVLTIDNKGIAPAICYESLLPEHSEKVFQDGAEIYLASVAKSKNGIDKALRHFPDIAKKYSMTVLMSNCIGHCDNFESSGMTSIWNNKGELVGQLNDSNEGILIIDTATQEIIEEESIQ